MKTTPVTPDDLRGVFAVPPLCRKAAAGAPARPRGERSARAPHGERRPLAIPLRRQRLPVSRDARGVRGASRLAERLDGWAIPSIGPSFGRAMDQAPLLRRHRFPAVMALPCGDPRDAAGPGGGTAGDRVRRRHEADPVPQERGRLRQRPHGRPRRRGPARGRGRVRRDQVRRRAQGPGRRSLPGRAPRARGPEARGERHRRAARGRPHAAASACRASRPARAASRRRSRARSSRPARAGAGTTPRRCAPCSCRSRTGATRGGRRGCCTRRPSSPASRRPGPIPPFVTALARRPARGARAPGRELLRRDAERRGAPPAEARASLPAEARPVRLSRRGLLDGRALDPHLLRHHLSVLLPVLHANVLLRGEELAELDGLAVRLDGVHLVAGTLHQHEGVLVDVEGSSPCPPCR